MQPSTELTDYVQCVPVGLVLLSTTNHIIPRTASSISRPLTTKCSYVKLKDSARLPKHAIAVGSLIDSMKLLCAGQEKCVQTEKMVDNLNLLANARAKINDRVKVPPYHIRFPTWCVMVAQAIELTWSSLQARRSIAKCLGNLNCDVLPLL